MTKIETTTGRHREQCVWVIRLLAVGLVLGSCTTSGRVPTTIVLIRFADVQGLRTGDPVQVSGVSVGRVKNVELKNVDTVIVSLAVNDDVRPHADATARIAALDLFGARYIDYKPGTAPKMLGDSASFLGATENVSPTAVPVTPVPGTRWEYYVLRTSAADPWRTRLSGLGNEGWELVTAIPELSGTNLIFNRPGR